MSNKASEEMVNVIRDVIQQEIAKKGQTVLCQITEKKDDRHYDLFVVPDESTIIHNVVNSTRFDLRRGDYVYIYKINNQLNNAFIISKIEPYAPQYQQPVNKMVTDISANLRYNNVNHTWVLSMSNDLCHKCMSEKDVRITIYRRHSRAQTFRIPQRTIDRREFTAYACDSDRHQNYISWDYESKEIDVTSIVNNYLYNDKYICSESPDAVAESYRVSQYWYKQFGFCILSSESGKLWYTTKDQLYTVKTYIDPRSESVPDPNLTVVIDSERVIKLHN